MDRKLNQTARYMTSAEKQLSLRAAGKLKRLLPPTPAELPTHTSTCSVM